jgi:GNAT superfamily N-acetyltransferase
MLRLQSGSCEQHVVPCSGGHEAMERTMSSVRIVERRPTIEEYLRLADAVGWSRYVSRAAAEIALSNTWFATVAEIGSAVVGMGRIIGDGGIFFYIQDLVVVPAHQGTGVGARTMEALMAHLHRAAPDGAFVGLFSAAGKTGFYERFGFQAREAERTGMSQYFRVRE